MGAIQDIFRDHAADYIKEFGDRIPKEHYKVIYAIRSCRTPDHGVTVYKCEECGKPHRIFRSCGNRHCPTCQNNKALEWLDRRLEKELPAPYFMITFTVPADLRRFIRSNRRISYGAMFKASSEAIKTLTKEEKHIGGDVPGFFGVLHTWGRTLNYHPHIHYVVPGGAWSKEKNQWMPSNPRFFLPVKALSKIYRAKFRDIMRDEGLFHLIPNQVWREGWNVHIQPGGQGMSLVKYLSYYVFKVAISDHRIVNVEDGKITFQYKKPKSSRTRHMTLDALEFMRRFLQNALPKGFMKVRYYGFLNAACSVSIDDIRASIEMTNAFDVIYVEPEVRETIELFCPDCGGKLIYCYSVLPHGITGYWDTS